MEKKIGLFLGCVIPTEQYGYEMSIREIMKEFDVELVDVPNISCCGGPFKSINIFMQIYLSARNIAIFEKKGLDIYAPCPQCHLSLSETKKRMKDSPSLAKRVRSRLEEEEGLLYNGDVRIYHTIDLFHDAIGLDVMKEKVKHPLPWNIACHYGCQTIRYSGADRPDAAEHPLKMEEIIRVLGGSTRDYSEKLNCCGGPLITTHKDAAYTTAGEKLKAVNDRGFDALSIVCPYGGRMMDSKQEKAGEVMGEKLHIPVFYLTQLIGLSLGMSPGRLGLDLNLSPVEELLIRDHFLQTP